MARFSVSTHTTIRMLCLAYGVALAGAVHMVGHPCPFWNYDEIQQHPANVTVFIIAGQLATMALEMPKLKFPPSPSHMQLYVSARDEMRQLPETGAVLMVDCVSGNLGLAFATYTLGMDCAIAHANDIMQDIDAVDVTDERTVKMLHLLWTLDEWQREGECRNWIADWPQIGAMTFWFIMAGAFWIGRAWTAVEPQKAMPSPLKRPESRQLRARGEALARTARKKTEASM